MFGFGLIKTWRELSAKGIMGILCPEVQQAQFVSNC